MESFVQSIKQTYDDGRPDEVFHIGDTTNIGSIISFEFDQKCNMWYAISHTYVVDKPHATQPEKNGWCWVENLTRTDDEKKDFSFIEHRPLTVQKHVSLEEFTRILLKSRPRELYHSYYSEKTPCWYIVDYFAKENKVVFFAEGWADKTPKKVTLEKFYDELSGQGLQFCFFK